MSLTPKFNEAGELASMRLPLGLETSVPNQAQEPKKYQQQKGVDTSLMCAHNLDRSADSDDISDGIFESPLPPRTLEAVGTDVAPQLTDNVVVSPVDGVALEPCPDGHAPAPAEIAFQAVDPQMTHNVVGGTIVCWIHVNFTRGALLFPRGRAMDHGT